jgi:hypothetical protein
MSPMSTPIVDNTTDVRMMNGLNTQHDSHEERAKEKGLGFRLVFLRAGKAHAVS